MTSTEQRATADPNSGRGAVRSVTVLGSTGSVGCNTLDMIASAPEHFRVEALTALNAVNRLVRQALQFRPRLVVVGNPDCYSDLKEALSGTGIEVAAGPAAVEEAAARPSDWVMAAIVGAAGLRPTLAAVRRGAIIALANKETLVCAGHLMMDEVARHGATLLPVDSEHNAIFQVFDEQAHEAIERIILTASGGPFRSLGREAMEKVTPEQAVAHPNWDMGAKISIDSATMMNKGLEVIEAHHLFDMPEERIEVLVHPQSIVHSLVAYADGSVLAQLGEPDMRTPIAYALSWPRRMAAPVTRLDLAALGTLTFEAPDVQRFPALDLARTALREGGGAPSVLNAANEVAVAAFLEGRIGFLDIAATVEEALSVVRSEPPESIEQLIDLDFRARRETSGLVQARALAR